MIRCTSPIRRRGLSQIEVVVSSLIVGVVLVGALNVLGGATRTHLAAADQLDGPGLAHQLMGEVLALPYEDPEEPGGSIGLETGEGNSTRVDFDDLDDYENWSQIPPETKDGTPLPHATDWQRKVFVQYFDPSTGSTTATDTGVKHITVQIIPPSGPNFQLQALRSKWGSLEEAPPVDTTVVTSLDAELQIGVNSDPASASIHLKNYASD